MTAYCEYFSCLISKDARGRFYEFNVEGGDIAAAWLRATNQSELIMPYYHYFGY